MEKDRQLTRFKLNDDNNDEVWVEIEEIPIDADSYEGDIRRTARPQAEHERRFQEAVERIRPAANAVFSAVHDLNAPKQIELEFGIGFSGKVGAFIASADTSASFKVKLTWENPSPKRASSR